MLKSWGDGHSINMLETVKQVAGCELTGDLKKQNSKLAVHI